MILVILIDIYTKNFKNFRNLNGPTFLKKGLDIFAFIKANKNGLSKFIYLFPINNSC